MLYSVATTIIQTPMVKWAVIFYVCFWLYRFWAQKRALKKIKLELNDKEEILSEINPNCFFTIFYPVLVGAFWGKYMIPFIIDKELVVLDFVSRNDFGLGIIGVILALFLLLLFYSKENVLTTKRIFNKWSFDFLKIFEDETSVGSALYKSTDLNYSDIEEIRMSNLFFVKYIELKTKDNNSKYYIHLKEINKIYKLIEEHINKIK